MPSARLLRSWWWLLLLLLLLLRCEPRTEEEEEEEDGKEGTSAWLLRMSPWLFVEDMELEAAMDIGDLNVAEHR